MIFMRKIDEWKLRHVVIPDNFYEGWYAGITNSGGMALEYASASGYYHLNPARKIAYQGGYRLGQEMLKEAAASLGQGSRMVGQGLEYEARKNGQPIIPPEVKALCYATIK